MMRHRDAWAEPTDAPSREQYEAEAESSFEERAARQAAETEREQREATRAEREGAHMTEESANRRRVVTSKSEDLPRDVLVVVSKIKAYIKASSGMNTSDGVTDVLSDHLRSVCERAIENANKDGRKTVLDRDFKGVF
jgi:histone H3/H4